MSNTESEIKTLHPSSQCREKYWEELDDAGKIARLRDVVKRLERQVTNMSATASRASEVAKNHQHAPSGEVLVPANDRNCGNEVGGRRDEKWF